MLGDTLNLGVIPALESRHVRFNSLPRHWCESPKRNRWVCQLQRALMQFLMMHLSGFGLVTHILETHEDAFVYAGARDPDNSIALKDLSQEYPGRISIVKCVYGDSDGNAAMAKEIEERHGRVDTVIANAGMSIELEFLRIFILCKYPGPWNYRRRSFFRTRTRDSCQRNGKELSGDL